MSDKELKTTKAKALEALETYACHIGANKFNWHIDRDAAMRDMFGEQLDEWEDVTEKCMAWPRAYGDCVTLNCDGNTAVVLMDNGDWESVKPFKIEDGRIWRRK